MALSNIGREPCREIIEQVAGLLFILAWVGWTVYSVHLSTLIYMPSHCLDYTDTTYTVCSKLKTGYWIDPSPLLITIGLSLAPFLVYPFLLLMHAIGEFVCEWMSALGIDPRPHNRYR